jgi:hypothetical protein
MLRESVRTSPTLAKLSAEAERLFYRLLVTADDHGRFLADPAIVRSQCFPRDDGKIRIHDVRRWLSELGEVIRIYSVGGELYGEFRTWSKHQRVRAATSRRRRRAMMG